MPNETESSVVPERPSVDALSKSLELIFLLALPLVAFVAFHFKPRIMKGMVDPYFYTGYINNFEDLFRRFGRTYFGVRFGFILPARFFTWIFGVEPGFFVLRYLLALIFGVPLYLVVRKHLSTVTAVVVYAVSVSSPYFARALLWDHPDATGVPFLAAAICLVLLDPRQHLQITYFAAGCVAALALNSNIFTAAILGIFAVCHATVWISERRQSGILLRQGLFVTGGVITVTATATIYYRVVIGSWNIFGPTLFMAYSLSTRPVNVWRTPGVLWTLTLFHVFVPVWLCAGCLMIWAGHRRQGAIAVITSFALAVTAFYYIHQFLLNGDTLQYFFYFSYAMPAVFLLFALVNFRLWEQARIGAVPFATLSIAAVAAPWLLRSFGIGIYGERPLRSFLSAAALALVIGGIAARRQPGRATRIVSLAGVVVFGVAFDLGFSTYASAIQPRTQIDTSEIDTYRVALQLIKEVPPMNDPNGKTLFWYNSRIGSPINWVQSTFLWNYSRINKELPEDPGLPTLTAGEVTRLVQKDVRYLGLLCETPAELEMGLAALNRSGIPFQRDRRELRSGGLGIWWDLLQLKKTSNAGPGPP